MEEDPWGSDEPPIIAPEDLPPLPARLVALAEVTSRQAWDDRDRWTFPSVWELAEVQALAADGWRPLDATPSRSCLPAVWPRRHRCWLPDRLPRVALLSSGAGGSWIVPSDDWQSRLARYAEEDAAECGLPVGPAGRLWLLRSPWSSIGFDVVLGLIARRCRERRLPPHGMPLVETTRELVTWPEARIWSWWTGSQADRARTWRSLGRMGEDVVGLLHAGLGPDEVAALVDADTDGTPGLTEAQAVAWGQAVSVMGGSPVDNIWRMRRGGLPADPPTGLMYLIAEMAPEGVPDWLEAGFTLDDMRNLIGVGLVEASGWREHGFRPGEVRDLLAADPTLSPEHALAFTHAGLSNEARLRWVEAGFDAATSRAWTDLDVFPEEARVWRSVGKDPERARQQLESGVGRLPPGVAVGWTGSASGRADRRYDVADPPGTSGRSARRARERDSL